MAKVAILMWSLKRMAKTVSPVPGAAAKSAESDLEIARHISAPVAKRKSRAKKWVRSGVNNPGVSVSPDRFYLCI